MRCDRSALAAARPANGSLKAKGLAGAPPVLAVKAPDQSTYQNWPTQAGQVTDIGDIRALHASAVVTTARALASVGQCLNRHADTIREGCRDQVRANG